MYVDFDGQKFDVKKDVESFYKILIKHNVDVLRPDNIKNCNQVFARDLGFTISNIFFQSNIVPNREEELVGVLTLGWGTRPLHTIQKVLGPNFESKICWECKQKLELKLNLS